MPFRDLVGHRHVIRLMARAVANGALPPSLIFEGPAGVGKRRAAVALAQLVNCGHREEHENGVDACGECPSCRRIARGVHPDVRVVEPGETGSIKVDQARQVIEQCAYRPFEGRRRVVIVDEADALEVSAQNALLKTLEEPPPASTFVLNTSRPDVLLPTVRSRCQRLRFGRLAPPDVAAVLTREHGFSEGEAHAAAALADGSVGLALEGRSAHFEVSRDKAATMLRMVASSRDARGRLAAARLIGGEKGDKVDREELARRLRLLASMLRDLGLLGVGADAAAVVNVDQTSALGRLLPSFDRDRTVRAFAAVDRALAALERNASPRIVADWLAFQV
jgi:DNA polymerase III subunit delta'